ncbi:hypothetical protein L228DRAFT_268260 [Xylona heveae TC161]|uniref:polynucleotide adenylyltransferase n=1 Tax=Xylona heveae (strain CBS 132557 / TC161) TaxID=1328760 RepID=A0A165H200_XYLHT|nr:hypothetical protein L228DRAFT_268260 [Xylona heveae TC161]KZF22882.1 hypothetical protein L228DRAFT_268260 [Xylona heveae TC161]
MPRPAKRHPLPPRPPAAPRSSSPRPSMYSFGGDSYRPGSNDPVSSGRGKFSFRPAHDAPSYSKNVDLADRYVPRGPRARPSDYRKGRQQRRGDRDSRGYGRWRPRPPIPTHERPLLQARRGSTPEQLLGMNEEQGTGGRYLDVSDVSDSEEEDMEMDSDEDEKEQKPSHDESKEIHANSNEHQEEENANSEQNEPENPSAPRWSNPDPYTVLPPPDESQRKKKDMVKLIRKARVNSQKEEAPANPVSTNADFISLDFGDEAFNEEKQSNVSSDEDEQETSRLEDNEPPADAPKEPKRFSHLTNLHGPLTPTPSAPGTDGVTTSSTLGPPPGIVPPLSTSQAKSPLDVWPPPTAEAAVGKRKRDFEDLDGRPTLKKAKGGKKAGSGGFLVEEWQPQSGADPTPWCTVDHSRTEKMGYWLHKEVCDFYNYVRPREFEDVVRRDLLARLQRGISRRYPGCEVRSFGSFAAGLYLPNSDMDVVLVSRDFLRRGIKQVCQTSRHMFQFRAFLEREGIPVPGTVEVIAKARVPIVKFIDKATGLKVDMSFENDTGIVANETFQAWRHRYPAMPVIVTVIKQFLMMRGLNEVFTGGLGGFSVTCLVTSLLQNMPQVQSGNFVPEKHLGEVLMEFFDLYGNEFNVLTTGIQLEPPGYFEKRSNMNIIYQLNKMDRLSIVDPNKPDNDISSGSSNVALIFRCFSEAYEILQKRMADLRFRNFSERRGQSILGTIMAGDYSWFEWQRDRLRRLYDDRYNSLS